MEFGLGLILSFTDNATAGINNAVNSLNNLTSMAESASASMNQMASLSAVSVVADRLGSSFLNVGRGIFGMFNEVLNQTRGIGQEFEDFDVTLTALFGGAERGAKKSQEAMSKLFDFAKKSPLEVGEVKDMIVTLESQGINAFEKTTGSISGTRQEFLAFLTDLKSFKPEVSNERFKLAIQNYIGSGEKKMMRTVFDMGDIEQIIGHGVSKTAEGRMQDIIEMVEKKGLTNLSTKMSKTMTGVMSNVRDAFTQVYYAIASNGVFDKLKGAFMSVANTIVKIDPSRLQAMGKTIAEGLNIVVTPITKFAKFLGKLITKIIDLCETNPALVKFMMSLTAIAGALFVAIGVILKATSAFSGLSLMIIASGKNISELATTMRTGILKMLATLLPFIATIGLLALAWKLDLAGIQTNTRMFASNVVNSFREAKNGVNGNIEDMKKIINGKGSKFEEGSFFHNITKGIMKVMVFMRALSEAWNGYTLSEDTFLKAKELGLLPLIEAVLDLKYRFGFFKKGFIAGWQEIGEKVKNVIGGIVKGAKGTFLEDMLNNLTKFLQKLGKGDTQAWYKFGESFAKFTAKAIAFWAVFKVADKVIGKLVKVALAIKSIGKVFDWFGGLGGKAIGKITSKFPNLINALTKLPKAITKIVAFVGRSINDIIGFFQLVGEVGLKETLTGLFGTVATTIAGIVSVIGGIVLAFTNFFSMLKTGFNWLKEALMVIGVALATIGVIILAPIEGIGVAIAAAVGGIVALVMTAVVLVKQYWNEICSFFSTIADWINTNIIQPIINFFSPMFDLIKQMWNSFMETVDHVVQRVKGFIDELVSGVKSIWDNIMSYIQPCIDTFIQLKNTFFEFCSFIGQKLSELWTGIIQPTLSSIGSFFSSVFSAIGNVISSVMNFIWNIITSIWNAIWGFISPIVLAIWNTIQNVFTSIFDTIMNVLSSIWQGIVGIVNGIVTFVVGILSNIFQTICNVFTGIMNFIMGKHEQAKANFSQAWENIKGIFKSAWNGIKGIVTSVFGAIWNTIKSIANGIKNTFSSIFGGIVRVVSTTFNTIKTTISNILTGAWNIIRGIVNKIKNAFNFKWSLPSLKLPHVKVKGGEAPFGIGGKGSLPKFSVDWYAKGGVFEKPSVIGVGEAGTEAVMPLQNNTEWIGILASMIVGEIRNIVPKPSNVINSTTNNNGGSQYMTSNTNNSTISGDTDNSININSGAIQIIANNSSDKEAERLAKKIMEYIKRQQELDMMTNYA